MKRQSLSRRAVSVVLSGLAVAALAVGVTACGGTSSGSDDGGGDGSGGNLSLVAYSTPQEAYEKITKAFNATPEGKGVNIQESFGGSGDQARAVLSGLPADVVALSLEPDIQKLVDAGKVSKDWANNTYKGIVTDSVVVFAVRKGNPKNIKNWEDLLKPDVEVVTPNPATSGGAKWNILAAYGAASDVGKDPEKGEQYLRDLLDHVVAQDKSAREALQTFSAGKGDVLLAYENEAITAQQKGEELDFVIPDDTLLIENPAAVTTDSQNPEKAKEFLDYLWTPEAQKLYASQGYRPVVKSELDESKFPTPPGLFTVADLGGWAKVDKEFFDDNDGIFTKIQQEAGG
jgi:sulfate/thiosulfate-binding protein